MFKGIGTDKKSKLMLIIGAAIAVFIAAGAFIYISGTGAVDKKDDTQITVTIPTGSGASAIVDILDEQGLIKNKFVAKVHVRLGGYDSLQANSYIFSKNMGLKEMMEAINTGDMRYLSMNRFTIIEGATAADAAKAMAENLPFTAEEILAKWSDTEYLQKLIDQYWFLTDEILKDGIMYPLEGYLYPETYIIFEENPTIEGVTEEILTMIDEKLSEIKDQISKMDMTVHQFLSLTSVVENESLFEKDRPAIAGVFINRLHEGMPLQSDITVLYALQERRVDVTYSDLEVDSLYNTYKYTGLPVGPVCSPSAPTMEDVLHYEKSDYLFFFATEDGEVLYSKTLKEHEKIAKENAWY